MSRVPLESSRHDDSRAGLSLRRACTGNRKLSTFRRFGLKFARGEHFSLQNIIHSVIDQVLITKNSSDFAHFIFTPYTAPSGKNVSLRRSVTPFLRVSRRVMELR